MYNNIPNKFYFINTFKKNIDKLDSNTGVIFRNYKSNMIIKDIIQVETIAQKKKKSFTFQIILIALKLKLDGAYIPSFYKNFVIWIIILKIFFSNRFHHNVKEIRLKEVQKYNYYSFLRYSRKIKFLGLYKFKILQNLTTKKL